MKVLGVDFGDSKIGLAKSDSFGLLAHGLETIRYEGNLNKVIESIRGFIDEFAISKIVVGYPRNMDGSVGERGKKTDVFIGKLKLRFPNIDVIKWDERLSTKAAAKIMIDTGVKRGKKKHIEDQIAAAYILQGYLDSVRI